MIKLINRGISINRLLSHTGLDLVFSKAPNSASMVDLTMQFYLDDFEETTSPTRVNKSSPVGFTSSVSKIQLASKYPSKIG